MADLPLPSASNCLTPLIESLVANNPRRLDHINYGVGKWSNPLAGWRAQATLNLRRVADEMTQARLPLASGQGLRELVASKFFASIVDTPTTAIGEIQINVPGAVPGTTYIVPKGTRWRVQANPRAIPLPISAADFVTTADTRSVWGSVNWNPIKVPIACTTTGVAGNIIIEHNGPAGSGPVVSLVDPLYDDGGNQIQVAIAQITCAGGGAGFSDAEVRAIAGAQPQGRRGPTDGAIYAGSYLALGVRHVAVFDDLVNARTVIFAADESWASDTAYWQPAIVQALIGDGTVDAWAGFGCAINPSGVGTVDNIFLNIEATVQLRSQQQLAQTEDVRTKVQAKITSYLNDRPNWYSLRSNVLRGLIARADSRILTCTSVTVTDRFGNGVPDSTPILYGTAPSSLSHYALLAFTPTFVAPL